MSTKLSGYVVLGGAQPPIALPLSYSDDEHSTLFEGHIGARTRGKWLVTSSLTSHCLNIPSRDKQVQLLYKAAVSEAKRDAQFVASMETIDSEHSGLNYRAKLNEVLKSLKATSQPDEFVGAVLNLSSSTHASIALLSYDVPIYVYGLYDQELESAYVVWSTDPEQVPSILASMPLRFLLYRFPLLTNNCMFLQIETLCAKWWRWNKNHQSTLQAFNALEWRLYGNAN
jgi:hypothetical protein